MAPASPTWRAGSSVTPDLFQRVVAKEQSVHAAAVTVGFVRRTFAVPDDLEA
jgi:hypothetical protein